MFTNGIFFALTTVNSQLLEDLRIEILQSSELQVIVKDCTDGTTSQYTFRDCLLYFKNRLMLASGSPLKMVILQEFHSSPLGGHVGILKTLIKIFPNFFWTRLREDVRRFVHDCYICHKIKSPTSKLASLLQPLPIPKYVWENLSMNFITDLPPSKGNNIILVVVDRLSNVAHFSTLPALFTDNLVATLFTNMVIKYHGFSLSIISDRDHFS